MNPFSQEYFATELAHYGLKDAYNKNGVSVWSDEQAIPFLKFDDTIWMTLKPKIIQTHYLTTSARGAVLAGGLGLGYFPLRAAAKEEVDRVDVYELDGRVIEFFREQFSDRPEMNKINLVQGDLRELASGHYDYALVDIYTNPIGSISRVLEDLTILKSRITVSRIQVWCEEILIKVGRGYGLDIPLEENERQLFSAWKNAPFSIYENLHQLYQEACHQVYPWQIRAYLSLVERPFKSYYWFLTKWGLTEGVKRVSRK